MPIPLTPIKTNQSRPSTPFAQEPKATPSKRITAATPQKALPTPAAPPRLTIHKIVLINFKSYADTVEIGPFDVSFSAIVGPNGSGKSNTIDALLFVFGWRASKMRQGKLSELIHNSEGRMNLDSCSVEIHFREVVDIGPGQHRVCEGSNLIVARTAYRNNSSKYTINRKLSNFTEVTTLLKGKGIDLDHKRFLILQGEVESIAQMKPKAPNEHEDGLLEYLEDIIGTSRFKEPIEKASEEVDQLGEVRSEKLNRVRLVESEKKALEPRKKEADEFLRDQNRLTEVSSRMYQVYRLQYNRVIAKNTEEAEKEAAFLEEKRAAQADTIQAVEDKQKEYEEALEEAKAFEAEAKTLEKELQVFDQEAAQMNEEAKHHSSKQKKLKKSVSDDTHAKNQTTADIQTRKEEVAKFTAEIERLEKSLETEESELEKIRDSLKDKTLGISAQITEKQAELQPWAEKVSKVSADRSVAVSERELLQERASSAQRAIEEAKATLETLQEQSNATEAEIDELTQEKEQAEQQFREEADQSQALLEQLETAKAKAAQARQKAEEARSVHSTKASQSKVLTELTKLAQQGRLSGFHGRLGDLGRIDAKYDVAISTASPSLNNLVCETVKTGQDCLEHLRRTKAGRAVIMCLDQIQNRDLSRKETPENAARLYDLITPKDAKFAPVFYEAVKDTLVAKDMEQARRLAYGGSKRWRVVTLQGQLIDTSGTMSGGGQRVIKGLMGNKLSADELTPEAVAQLEKDEAKASEKINALQQELDRLQASVQELRKKPKELDLAIAKLQMTFKSCGKRMEESKRRVKELGSQLKPEAGDVERIAALDAAIAKHDKELDSLREHTSSIEQKVKELQDQIMAIGGTKLKIQSTKVTDIKARIDLASDRLTKSQVAGNKAEKDAVKLDKAIETNTEALQQAEEELAVLTKKINANQKASQTYRDQVEIARQTLEERKENLEAIKQELDEYKEAVKGFRKLEIQVQQKREKLLATIKDTEKQRKHMQTLLDELVLHDIDDDDDDDEPTSKTAAQEAQPAGTEADKEVTAKGATEEAKEDAPPQQTEEASRPPSNEIVLREYAEEELDDMALDQLKHEKAILEERTERAKPNLAVLQEYRKREQEWQERAKDLEQVTQKRDAAKKAYEDLRKQRLEEFMDGFSQISLKLKEMYQMITMGGNAELELVDSLDPFSEGIVFSVMPPKKSWKHISNLSGGEKTLSSLALVFALHIFKPTPLYFMDEIDAALDFRNVSIVAGYIAQRTKNAQFIIISLRNNMFELATRLVGIYKTANCTKSVTIANSDIQTIGA